MPYKLRNIRATSLHRDLTEANHVKSLIARRDDKPSEMEEHTRIDQTIFGSSARNQACILFDIDGHTYWCAEQEFASLKFALENFKNQILMFYTMGTVSPYGNNGVLRSAGIDGYKVYLLFS